MKPSPFVHPDREKPRFKPFKAMKHMRALIADKEDTEQVFHIIEALSGDSLLKDLELFAETEKRQSADGGAAVSRPHSGRNAPRPP